MHRSTSLLPSLVTLAATALPSAAEEHASILLGATKPS